MTIEGAEYLGRVGTRDGVVAARRHARRPERERAAQGPPGRSSAIAGADYGFRAEAWKHWARQIDPTLDFGDDADEEDAADAGPPGPCRGFAHA